MPGRLVGGDVVDQEDPVAHRVSRERGDESTPGLGATDLRFVSALRDDGQFGDRAVTRVRAWVRRGGLDAALAAGADPSESPLLACRAAHLSGRRNRDDMAVRIAEILAVAGQLPRAFSAAVEPDRAEVLAAAEELVRVEELLRSASPVYARGVALLKRLLSDSGSSIYAPRWRGELGRTLEQILAALEGNTGTTPYPRHRADDTLGSMEVHMSARDLVVDAVETAESVLRTGERLAPFMITDRWGDRRVEGFDSDALTDGKMRFREFVRGAAGAETCALVYIGRVGHEEDAIVIECGQAGDSEAEVFVQHFRPRRGRLRGFKLSGEPTPVGTGESVA